MGLTMVVDSVAGNVHDLGQVLAKVRDLTGLRPFLRFELELAHGAVPVAQVMCGNVSLEFLQHAQGQYPAGASRIKRVLLEAPDHGPEEQELEPGLWLEVRPGPRPRLAEIQIQSGAVEEDLAVLRSAVEAGLALSAEEGGLAMELAGAVLRFSPLVGVASAHPGADDDRGQPGQRLPGWHRIGLASRGLEQAVSALAQAGARVEVPPYQVLPGLREAMLRLPSGLVVQPVEQKLWKMLPVVGARALAAKLAGRPLQFRIREA